jgi:multisubunit Na+/H+ antiporter MnhG subunit
VAVAIALGDDSGVIGEIAVAVFVFIFLNTGSYYIAQAGLKL